MANIGGASHDFVLEHAQELGFFEQAAYGCQHEAGFSFHLRRDVVELRDMVDGQIEFVSSLKEGGRAVAVLQSQKQLRNERPSGVFVFGVFVFWDIRPGGFGLGDE